MEEKYQEMLGREKEEDEVEVEEEEEGGESVDVAEDGRKEVGGKKDDVEGETSPDIYGGDKQTKD